MGHDLVTDAWDRPEGIDVDALMARIRDEVAGRRASAPDDLAWPSATGSSAQPEVRQALAGQADFNRSVMEVLQLIGRCLADIQERHQALESRLREEAQQNHRARTPQEQETGDLSAVLHRLARRLDALEPRAPDVAGAIEARDRAAIAPTTVEERLDQELEKLRLSMRLSLAGLESLLTQRTDRR